MTRSIEPDSIPVTLDELLCRCMGELQFAQNILNSFLTTCQAQLGEIFAEIEDGTADTLAQKIHRLKGTAATVAARPLRRSLEQLESIAMSDDPQKIQLLLEQFEKATSEYQRVEEFVNQQMK